MSPYQSAARRIIAAKRGQEYFKPHADRYVDPACIAYWQSAGATNVVKALQKHAPQQNRWLQYALS